MPESPAPLLLSRRSTRNSTTPRLAALLVALSVLLLALGNAGFADDDDDDDDDDNGNGNGNGNGGRSTTELTFSRPTFVSNDIQLQAAEPSIRVDIRDRTRRIWITAPAGILPNSRSLPKSESGDLVWYSDDNGRTWKFVPGPEGAGSPTLAGGGDSDVVTGPGPEVYLTGLTLANITLASSCNRGRTFVSNPISNVGSVEDRQWIDGYEDRAKPAAGPEFLLNYGGVAERRMWVHQVAAPCVNGTPATPVADERVDVSHPQCVTGAFDPDCYQWPGNLAVDERTGDVYVTHNTFGSDDPPPHNDDVVVARINQAGARQATQADVRTFIAANNRPDTFDSFTVVAVDRASNVYVVWTERRPAYRATYTMLAVSKDRGRTWSDPIRVSQRAGTRTTTFPWIVAGDRGKIDIVYYGTSARGKSPERVARDSKWKVWMAQSLNALSDNPTFTEVPATGFMHQGRICTSGTGCGAGTRDLLDFFQVDIDEQGLANIAYTDNLNTPPDPGFPPGLPPDLQTIPADKHQEWVTFVQQRGGKGLFG